MSRRRAEGLVRSPSFGCGGIDGLRPLLGLSTGAWLCKSPAKEPSRADGDLGDGLRGDSHADELRKFGRVGDTMSPASSAMPLPVEPGSNRLNCLQPPPH
jgi:hypothetical protein